MINLNQLRLLNNSNNSMKYKLIKYLLLILVATFIAYVSYMIYDDINTARIDAHETSPKEANKILDGI